MVLHLSMERKAVIPRNGDNGLARLTADFDDAGNNIIPGRWFVKRLAMELSRFLGGGAEAEMRVSIE